MKYYIVHFHEDCEPLIVAQDLAVVESAVRDCLWTGAKVVMQASAIVGWYDVFIDGTYTGSVIPHEYTFKK